MNPRSPDKKIANVTKERYQHVIQIAKSLNASYLVLHSQINSAIKDPKVQEIKANRQVPFWEDLLKEIDDIDLTILLENFSEDNFRDILILIEKINSPKVKICLDLGHVLSNSSYGIREWIDSIKPYLPYLPYLPYIHLHWNDGSYDAHQAPIEDFLKELALIFVDNNINPVMALEYSLKDLEDEVKRIRSCF